MPDTPAALPGSSVPEPSVPEPLPPEPFGPAPSEDLAVCFPALAGLRASVERRDWAAVDAFFADLDEEDDRAAASLVVRRAEGALGFLLGVADGSSGPVLARVLLADTLIAAGWAVRSDARAKDVSREQFSSSHDYLRRAEQLLIDVVADDPGCALAWYLRITTARGLELGQAEARRRYDRLAEHRPHFFAAQAQLLQQLCPKWSGTWDAVHAFARECLKDAPAGGLGAGVTAHAYIEHWLDLDGGADDALLRDPDSIAELRDAARRLVGAPVLGRGYHRPTAHGGFAFLFGELRRPADTTPHFDVLAACPSLGGSPLPWDCLGGGAVRSYTGWHDWMAKQDTVAGQHTTAGQDTSAGDAGGRADEERRQ